jgi:hypothetical protein
MLFDLSYQTRGIYLAGALFLLFRFFSRTDTPKIKNLPEIPGYPLFGSLLKFGDKHAKVAAELAKKYGPVFQVRLGNRVSPPPANVTVADPSRESCSQTHLTLSDTSGSQTSPL